MNDFTGLFFDRITAEDIRNEEAEKQDVHFRIIRYDRADALTGGNKWFKLFPFLEKARLRQKSGLLSMGGPYSNHIAALAAVGVQTGFKTIGIIRGEEVSNLTLNRARQQGMELDFVSRSLYRELRAEKYRHPYIAQFGSGYLLVPEGGNAAEGQEGAQRMYDYIPADTTDIVLPAATGTTAAGIRDRLQDGQQLHVIPVLNNFPALAHLKTGSVSIHPAYTFGGYARSGPLLDEFCQTFSAEYGIAIEPIYSGKALYAAFDLLRKGFFRPGAKVSFLHTGGLQYQNS